MRDILVQSKRDQRAAQRLMRKLLHKFGMSPSSVVTDRLPSYEAAFSELGLSKKHVQGRGKEQSSRELAHRCVGRCDVSQERHEERGDGEGDHDGAKGIGIGERRSLAVCQSKELL